MNTHAAAAMHAVNLFVPNLCFGLLFCKNWIGHDVRYEQMIPDSIAD